MKKLFFIAMSLMLALQVSAQKIQLKVEFPTDADVSNMKFYASPTGGGYETIKEMVANGNVFTAEVDASDLGFYNLTGVKNQTQMIMPLYFADRAGQVTVKAELEGTSVRIVGSDDNSALSTLSAMLAELSIEMWKSGKMMGEKKLRKLLGDYTSMVKKSDPKGKASQPVKDYMNIWSYTSHFNLVDALPRILNVSADEVPFKSKDLLPAPVDVLDSPLTSLFPLGVEIVRICLPEGSLTERIDYLRANYETTELRGKVEEGLLSRHVAKYDYATDFDGGLRQLQELTDKYSLDTKFVEQFKKNRSTVKGTIFPSDVVLKDKDGNVVDFASFRGKYVYIDVWASWCGPCIQQIPHLQKLESELRNDNVVFMSVSVDAKGGAWKKKMETLGVHGNQLWDSANQLTKSLNISGIPFFLIYDSEGKLYMYDAPRPSQGEGLRQLLEGLGK